MSKSSKEVKDVVSQLARHVQVCEKKVDVMHQSLKNILSILAATEVKIEALKTLGIRKDVFSEDEFSKTIEEIRGGIDGKA